MLWGNVTPICVPVGQSGCRSCAFSSGASLLAMGDDVGQASKEKPHKHFGGGWRAPRRAAPHRNWGAGALLGAAQAELEVENTEM